MTKIKIIPKEVYENLSNSSQKNLRNHLMEALGISQLTFQRRLNAGFDLVEEKLFYKWFEEQGVFLTDVN